MSTISNTHNISPYISGTTKPFTGQRLATVTYKVNKETKLKPDSVCASIPQIQKEEVQDYIHRFMPHIIKLAEKAQDGIIRAIHESGASVVQSSAISMESILEYMEQESTGGRLTKVQVSEWFTNAIEEDLGVALAMRLGISDVPSDEEEERITKMVEQFKEGISALTSGATKYAPDMCVQLKKALAFAPQDDAIAQKFIARLDTMQNKVPVSIFDAL